MTDSTTKRIAELNDLCRKGQATCQWVITRGIAELDEKDRMQIIHNVMTFDNFTKDNDPHREHDFGAFTYNGNKIFWKFDYYDKSLQWGSEDPSDPTKTTRVLTVMLASEY